MAAAWLVFRDPALTYAAVAVGALLPDVLDAALGGTGPGHSVLVGALFLAAVMVATRGRRRIRRRLLGLPIGFLLHLVLDGVWALAPSVLWWPVSGLALGSAVPTFGRGPFFLLALEIAGVAAGGWAVGGIVSTRKARMRRADEGAV